MIFTYFYDRFINIENKYFITVILNSFLITFLGTSSQMDVAFVAEQKGVIYV